MCEVQRQVKQEEAERGRGGTYDFVRVHDRLQAVRDGDDRHVLFEFGAQRLLDDGVGLII